MVQKKNEKYDLEKKRPLFFGIGMIVSLSLTLVAFEWKSPIDPVLELSADYEEFDEIIIPPTTITPPPPPPPKAPIIKPTVEEPEEEPDIIIDTEVDEEDIVEDIVPEPVFDEEEVEEAVRSFAEVMPSFEGGMQNFYKFMSKNIKYPQKATRMGIEGRVFIQFVVEKDGSLSNFNVVKGIGAGCDEEALRVMKLVPNFLPGKQGDVRVPVRMVVPIYFNLR